ncbi:MAG TPA: hypothetical protein VFA66_13660 [Gaiellaceae bacterium]|nr:hypothetical protein [Gaiellaceae bacterium]
MSDAQRPLVVPAGLRRCPCCREFKGRGIVPGWRYDLLEIVPVTCLCEGILCRYCDAGKIHRPLSNYFSERDGKVIHVSSFGWAKACQACWQRAQPTSKRAGELESSCVTALDGERGTLVWLASAAPEAGAS